MKWGYKLSISQFNDLGLYSKDYALFRIENKNGCFSDQLDYFCISKLKHCKTK